MAPGEAHSEAHSEANGEALSEANSEAHKQTTIGLTNDLGQACLRQYKSKP
jgi:hypothetical protein